MDFSTINVWAILVSAVAFFALGSIWYSPLLFAKVWMQATGVTEEKAKQANMGRTFSLAFLATLVISFNLAMFFAGKVNWAQGAFYGFLTGFGWVAMSMAVNDLFEQRSVKLYLINAGYNIVGYTIVGLILGAWH